jgi:Kef-type K+ transport system membrane component KefB/mannitol/fructose-specific phosphotransferase system IIA component (Ntr-type)
MTIAGADIIIPMLLLFFPIYLLPDAYLVDPGKRVLFSFFLASILTISALPVAVRVMYDLNILKSDMSFLVISALTINDVIGWVLIAIIMGMFGTADLNAVYAIKLVFLTIAFAVISMTLFRKMIDKSMTYIHEKLGADTGYKTTFVFIIGMLFGAMTLKIGIHSLFGFFIAGIVIGEAKHFSENDRHVINRLVHSLFVPIFFANIGLHLDLVNNFDWKLVLFITLISIAAKFIGAYAGAGIAKQSKFDRLPIAIFHTTGGDMQIVVAILALSSGLITKNIFVSIIASSIFTTIIIGPWLAYSIKKRKSGLLKIVFNQNSVILDGEFEDRLGLISHVSSLIAQRIDVPENTVLKEILKREEQMSTAMGKGLAFPHARLSGIHNPLIYVVRNKFGLEWDSPDGKAVRLAFFVITPESNPSAQLYILQMLAETLSNKELMEQIETTDSPLAIWEILSPKLEHCDHCFDM